MHFRVWSSSFKTFLRLQHDRSSSEGHVALSQFISMCVSVCPKGVKLLFPTKFQWEVPMVTRESEATVIGLFFSVSVLSGSWSQLLYLSFPITLFLSFVSVCWPFCFFLFKHHLIPHTCNDLTLKIIFTSSGKSIILLINTLSTECVLYMMHYTTGNGPVNCIILLREPQIVSTLPDHSIKTIKHYSYDW